MFPPMKDYMPLAAIPRFGSSESVSIGPLGQFVVLDMGSVLGFKPISSVVGLGILYAIGFFRMYVLFFYN